MVAEVIDGREQQEVIACGDDDKLATLAEKINSEHRQVESCWAEGLDHAVTCGRYLKEAKDKVEYGDWGQWLRDNCEVTERTAQMYRQVAMAADDGRLDEIRNGVSGLTFRKALALLRKLTPGNSESAHGDARTKKARPRWMNLNSLEQNQLIESVTASIEKEKDGEKKVEIAQKIIDMFTAGIDEAQRYIPGQRQSRSDSEVEENEIESSTSIY